MVEPKIQREKFRFFFRDKITKTSLFFSLFLNIIIWIFLVSQVKSFSELIPLHYNIYFGIDLLGPWYQVFILPLLGLAILIVNNLLAKIFLAEKRILSYFLVVASSLIQFLLLIASFMIIFVNLW